MNVLVWPGLEIIERPVASAFCQKLLMAAALDDSAVFEEQDHVGVQERTQSVRDHQGDPVLGVAANGAAK